MAYDCRVYRVLIASPSDVEEEREIAVRVLQQWNDQHSATRKVVLLPVRWETHTAPTYNSRPQEVVNRAIVDDCDLLVGIFWTRLGTATGEADSGTLEEIDRVGNAGKPIMLYFSRVGADPEEIEPQQLKRVKQFKERTYSKGLIESYKTRWEFQDKFAKHIDMKLKELQDADRPGKPPLLLTFISSEGDLGNPAQKTLRKISLADADDLELQFGDATDVRIAREIMMQNLRQAKAIPFAIEIGNQGGYGIRNPYVEMTISANVDGVDLTSDLDGSVALFANNSGEPDLIKEKSDVWTSTFEWNALQTERKRRVHRILWLISDRPVTLTVEAKVFADNFPQPEILKGTLTINIDDVPPITVREFIPDLSSRVEKERKSSTGRFGTGFRTVWNVETSRADQPRFT